MCCVKLREATILRNLVFILGLAYREVSQTSGPLWSQRMCFLFALQRGNFVSKASHAYQCYVCVKYLKSCLLPVLGSCLLPELTEKRGGLVHWTLDREVWVLADLPGLLWSTLMVATLHQGVIVGTQALKKLGSTCISSSAFDGVGGRQGGWGGGGGK